MSQPPSRRPPGGSRTPASRPRRVAGHAARPVRVEEDAELVEEPVQEPAEEPAAEHVDEPAAAEPQPARRTVRTLVVTIVLLLVVGVVEVVLLLGRDDPTEVSGTVSAERPVQLSELTVRSVVDQAATAAVTILSASSSPPEAYDEQVDAATATMTDTFAEEYRATKAEIREEFVEAGTEVTVDVSAQGVVTATPQEVVALLFLTQTTARDDSAVTPVQYRVTVTMVDTEDGWLVSGLQAR